MSTPMPGSGKWRALVNESVVDPEQRIVDPHHHLWPDGPLPYSLADLLADVGSGHKIERTVFMECRAAYRTAGVARLGARGLTYDTWHYHYQNREFLALARAVPDTMMILDHFGTPIGVGRYADQRDAIFEDWTRDIADIACCENVVAKLGGLAMPDNGFAWHLADRPPTSDDFVTAQGRYYRHMIECFGTDRCMFESNFPVDRMSLSYRVLWNGLKKIAAPFSRSERDAMFFDTATRVYRPMT